MTTSNRTRQGGNSRRPAGPPRIRRGRRPDFFQDTEIDYKDASQMRRFVNERGKINGPRRTGASAKNQRLVAQAVKRARHLALIPMAPHHNSVTEAVQDSSQAPQQVESTQSNGAPARESSPGRSRVSMSRDGGGRPDQQAETSAPEAPAADSTATSAETQS